MKKTLLALSTFCFIGCKPIPGYNYYLDGKTEVRVEKMVEGSQVMDIKTGERFIVVDDRLYNYQISN